MSEKNVGKKVLALVMAQVESADKERDKFLCECRDNFHHAVTWGQSAFKAAAYKSVFGRIEMLLKEGACHVDLYCGHRRELLFKAKYRESSTNTCSNMIERYELAAMAEFIEMIENL